MKLSTLAARYGEMRRAVGMKHVVTSNVLQTFISEVGDIAVRLVRAEVVRDFLNARDGNTRRAYRNCLHGFWKFAIAREFATDSPVPPHGIYRAVPFSPYIYDHDEIKRLLAATATLHGAFCPLRPHTYRTMILLLYGAGLRVSEATHLTLADVNLRDRIIAIRDTKFYKTRLVPIGRPLADALAHYRRLRMRLPRPQGNRSAFFCTEKVINRWKSGRRPSYSSVREAFRDIRTHARIFRKDGSRLHPRIHDLRHSFVVHRIEQAYREGADVDRLLPILATYIGHTNIESLQRYITMTPEMLREAGDRFEQYATPKTKP